MLSLLIYLSSIFFFFNDPATTEIYTLSLHDALPISPRFPMKNGFDKSYNKGYLLYPEKILEFHLKRWTTTFSRERSEEHTSELQSRVDLVCRLLLEKKKKKKIKCKKIYHRFSRVLVR